MRDDHDSPRLIKPVVPPLMKDSFTRMARPLSQLPKFANSPCPFRPNHLPQLPPMYDSVLAAIITSEPQGEDELGVDVQTWDEEKHTLFSLAQRGYLHFKARVLEKVQDLALGPFRDHGAIKAITETILGPETLALLCCCYAFPKPSTELPATYRDEEPRDAVEHAADMFMAYIGALRVPYRHDVHLGSDILRRLDKYLDDLISPKVWIKLDDLVKARSRGDKFGEQQLLNPQKKSLAERMTRNLPPPAIAGIIETQVPSFRLPTPSLPHSARNSPTLLHSPATQVKPLRTLSIPTGPRITLPPPIPTGPRHTLPPRPTSPNTSNSDLSDNGVGPKRSRQRSKRGKGGPMVQSQRGQGDLRLRINGDRWFET